MASEDAHPLKVFVFRDEYNAVALGVGPDFFIRAATKTDGSNVGRLWIDVAQELRETSRQVFVEE